MTQDEVDKCCESVPYNQQCRGSRRKLKYGVGVNDLPHIIAFKDLECKGMQHSGYHQWDNLLTRCYSESYKARQPTYVGVTVCNEWLTASNFVAWYKAQYKEEGWQLDKDLLFVGNKVYSPTTCIYVPKWLNSFTNDSGGSRGDCLIGVYWHKGAKKYMANCSNPITRELEYLGLFTSELEAHLAWRKRKLEIALELKPQMDAISLRIYPNVVTIIENAK